ncbi:MAG TPA: S53 family peptidase [Gemmataceae bacterium]|nr:S53 family peptidase [Gemmataceae bacterium]
MPPGQPYQSAGPTGYTPQQIQEAYGINQLYGIIGTGTGQTIAIVDAYDDPAFVDSTSPNFDSSDLHMFDQEFNLPDPPSFLKLNQTGGTALPGTDPAGPGTSNWEGEEALDIEWAHAIAPGANIIVFEANSASPSDLDQAVATAAAYPGVSVVSMSFGSPEDNTATSTDSIFTTPAGHQGVTFVAASGDYGSFGGSGLTTTNVDYPAASPNVLGVGGTSLVLNSDNSYNSETAWGNGANSASQGGSGGGFSQYESEPAYQESVQNTGKRAVPDVAFDADPNTGVAVYDSYNNGTATPWVEVGGTSLAAPSWSGLIAIADEGVVHDGGTTLNGPTQTIPDLYKLYQVDPSYFHDITSGSNGAYSAHAGYDEVTGMGSPVANKLIPALIGLQVRNTLSAATEGQPLNNVAVANFSDPTGSQSVGDYIATITWGDGSVTSGNIIADGGDLYTVLGSHTYINPGTYALTVSVQNTVYDLFGTCITNVNVADAPLEGSAQALDGETAEFVTNALVAVFTDTDSTPRPPSNYSATITWNEGDGLSFTSTGAIERLFGNTFAVYGSSPYTFPYGGLFPIQVVVTDLGGGASVTINSVVSVANNQAVSTLFPQYQSDTGPLSTQLVSMEDALTNLLSAERLFVYALVFGSTTEQKGTFGNLLNAFDAYESAIFAYDMSLPGS